MDNEEINFELIFIDKSYEDRSAIIEVLELLESLQNLDSTQDDNIPILSLLNKILSEDKELLQKLAQ
jgi:hypothetical protein